MLCTNIVFFVCFWVQSQYDDDDDDPKYPLMMVIDYFPNVLFYVALKFMKKKV